MCLCTNQILHHTEHTPENSMVSTVTMVTLNAWVFCSLCSQMAATPLWMTHKTHKISKSECFSRSARNRWREPKLIFSNIYNIHSVTVSSAPAITPSITPNPHFLFCICDIKNTGHTRQPWHKFIIKNIMCIMCFKAKSLALIFWKIQTWAINLCCQCLRLYYLCELMFTLMSILRKSECTCWFMVLRL